MSNENYRHGEQTRREVLGDKRVDASLADPQDFGRTMTEVTTQFAWGQIWTRPGIDRRTRSFMTLAMLAALNRPHEIAVHVLSLIHI